MKEFALSQRADDLRRRLDSWRGIFPDSALKEALVPYREQISRASCNEMRLEDEVISDQWHRLRVLTGLPEKLRETEKLSFYTQPHFARMSQPTYPLTKKEKIEGDVRAAVTRHITNLVHRKAPLHVKSDASGEEEADASIAVKDKFLNQQLNMMQGFIATKGIQALKDAVGEQYFVEAPDKPKAANSVFDAFERTVHSYLMSLYSKSEDEFALETKAADKSAVKILNDRQAKQTRALEETAVNIRHDLKAIFLAMTRAPSPQR